MNLVLENWRAASVSNPYPTNPAAGGSSYDNLILANYITILSLQEQEKDGRRNISWTLTLCKRDTQMTVRSPNPVHDLFVHSNLTCNVWM